MASTTYHAQLIKYDSSGNQSILNLKNTGDDVSISRTSNGNLPSTVTSAQTLANAFGSLAFKSAVAWADVSGITSTELTVSSEGKLADARAIKALNDKIATNASNITKLNSNLGDVKDTSKEADVPSHNLLKALKLFQDKHSREINIYISDKMLNEQNNIILFDNNTQAIINIYNR